MLGICERRMLAHPLPPKRFQSECVNVKRFSECRSGFLVLLIGYYLESHDTSDGDHNECHHPDVIVRPETVQQVAAVVALVYKARITWKALLEACEAGDTSSDP